MAQKTIDLSRPTLEIIKADFQGLYSGQLGLSSIKGGQTAANQALQNLDITRYAEQRSEVQPVEKRDTAGDGWNRDMHCIDQVTQELETDGWLVNQTRMWMASHWTVRNEKGWIHGQEEMYKT